MDLSGVPLVDNHAHALTRAQPETPEEFRTHFAEAHSPDVPRHHVGSAVHFRWAMHQLADVLGVDPTPETILRCRSSVPFRQYARDLAQGAYLDSLLLDEGYPPPDQAYSTDEMEKMLGVRVRRILRIETTVQDLIARVDSLVQLVREFDEIVGAARRNGYVSLKSIAAYRTGLAIEHSDARLVEQAFVEAKAQARPHRLFRLASKPLVDYFVLRGLEHAAAQGLPVQFHTGYGDPDLDLRLANPLHLRSIFEDHTLQAAPIVLLHESYPYTAEAAYLAAAYPNAYLDLAFSLPPLDRLQLRRVVETALGTAPASKLMCSSDGVGIPEHYWLGAVRARQVVGDVLDVMAQGGEIDAAEAEEIGRMLLRDNAVRVYGLERPET